MPLGHELSRRGDDVAREGRRPTPNPRGRATATPEVSHGTIVRLCSRRSDALGRKVAGATGLERGLISGRRVF
jgi:hypothetical protein